jgi:hypothetical protein
MRITRTFTAIFWLGVATLAHSQTSTTRPAPANGRYVAIGCLTRQGTGDAARYVVSDRRGDKPTVYRLRGDAELLLRHVGHTVEVTGDLATSPALTLTVRSLVWISSSCMK